MSLISSLFDFSFSSFVTTKFVRLIYALLLLVNGFLAITVGLAFFPLGLVLAPIGFLLGAAFARVGLEVTIVLFRIAENVQELARLERRERVEVAAVV